MHPIIEKGIKNSLTYENYRALVKQLVEDHATTGNDKSEAMVNYTKLNDKRMKRWDKTIKVSEEVKQIVSEFNQKITWLVIAESWCGDAAHVLPALNKIAELSDYINMKVVLRDENLELMDIYLTNGASAIPKVIMIDDETGEVINTYGPRPSEAANYVSRFKAKHGSLTPEFKEDLQHWYNNDKGQNVIKDIVEILCRLAPICQ
ncbi:thioredoxin family protein [Algibacter luteus]|uniref:thioredoxin family protein n=1 Tax=Algibacter luteus TaxID=1178825 RepID=UPI002594E309|nr:thioredoxin family protein [Algibacter luteus]WJJ97337.1 thioredoxin family protein [Algibacter luteus]